MKVRSQPPISASSANAWPDISSLVFPDLSALVADPDALDWQPFRTGIRIHRLYGDGSGASAALLRYEPGAKVPMHEHTGYEHIFVLVGSQCDRNGTHQAGSLVINFPGSRHDVTSPEGCIVLAVWEKPVVIQAE
jgi:anti-sigma factor ChrR (cupin superfamily)